MRELQHNELSYYDKLNAHPRDFFVFFEEGPNIHRYHIKGDSEGVISVTGFVHGPFPHFDGPKISAKTLGNESWLFKSKYGYLADEWKPFLPPIATNPREISLFNEWGSQVPDKSKTLDYIRWRIRQFDWHFTPLFQRLQEVVLKNWEDNRNDAATRGTAMHLNIENFYNHLPYESESPEWKLFEAFMKARPWFIVWRTEMRVWSKEHLLAGSIDMIYVDIRTGKYYVYDWKRSKEIKLFGYCYCAEGKHDGKICDGFGNQEATRHLPNCNYYQYSLQLWTYAAILELHYGIKIEGCFLVILHPKQTNFIELPAFALRDVVEVLLAQRALAVAHIFPIRKASKRALEKPTPHRRAKKVPRENSPKRK